MSREDALTLRKGESGTLFYRVFEDSLIKLNNSLVSRNIFQVTDEWRYNSGMEKNRADIMFLINGISVAIVETKRARIIDGIEKGLIQIREYHRETPEMLTAPQVFDITHLIDFYYGSTWNLDRKNLYMAYAGIGQNFYNDHRCPAGT